jgi:hypothetical protein
MRRRAGKNDMSIVITAALRDQPDTIRATIRAIWAAIASAMNGKAISMVAKMAMQESFGVPDATASGSAAWKKSQHPLWPYWVTDPVCTWLAGIHPVGRLCRVYG